MKKRMLLIISTLVLLLVFIIYDNKNIEATTFNYYNEMIPQEFEGFKICHISDLHNQEFGEGQKNIIKEVELLEPNIIVITGDLVDRHKYNLEIALEFIEGIKDLSPIYYVSGNHEAWSNEYQTIRSKLLDLGVIVLDDDSVLITKGNEIIELIGVSDPDFLTYDYLDGVDYRKLENTLSAYQDSEHFQILLSHRPELMDIYKTYSMELIFSGHAHGGQFKIPFIGGIVAPNQGFLPKYTNGEYTEGNTTMYVSRGLGNSIISLRINNRPQIINVILNARNK